MRPIYRERGERLGCNSPTATMNPPGFTQALTFKVKWLYQASRLRKEENMQEPNEIEQMFIDAINTYVIDEMEESQLRALLTVLEKVK